MKKLTTLIAVGGLAAALLAAWQLQRRPALAAPDALAGAAMPGAAAASAVVPGPAGSAPGAGGPVAVEVARVERGRLEDDAQAVGTLRSRQGVMLRPEVSGRIAKLAFADGQPVKRGQLLVQLDDALQRAQLQQAQAQAGIARTSLQRNRDLQAQNFVSQSAVDQSLANLQVAEAQVALAQAQLMRMRIVAPFDGIAGIRAVHTGDYVKDGADLVNIEDLSSVHVDFRLPERFVGRLKPGQGVEVAVDALPGRRLAARIEALDSQLDSNGRSVLVRARLGAAGGELRPGMFARARVVFEVREKALLVPEEALVPQGSQQFLVKVVDDAQGRKVSQRIPARIGQRTPGKVEILDGLREGDVVVVAGHARLMRGDGLPLRVVELGAAGRKAPPQAPGGGASAPAGGNGPRAAAAS